MGLQMLTCYTYVLINKTGSDFMFLSDIFLRKFIVDKEIIKVYRLYFLQLVYMCIIVSLKFNVCSFLQCLVHIAMSCVKLKV